MISKEVSEKVLIVGPSFYNHRGGIGAVLGIYNNNFEKFNFISTYSYKGTISKFYVFSKAFLKISYKLIFNKKIKVIHLHTSSRGSFLRKSIIFFLAKLFHKKVIFHIHGGMFHIFYAKNYFRKFIRSILNHADLLICLSEEWREFYCENFIDVKVEVLENPVQEAVSYQKDGDINKLNLLFLGKVGFNKGIYDLVDVIAKQKEFFEKNINLSIGGDGEVKQLEYLIEQHDLSNIVKYEGWVTGNLKYKLLSNCDVYILPSYNEAMPMSILEAMSAGKPIISTKVGGIPSLVIPGVNGWLMQPGDTDTLFNTIVDIVNDQQVLKTYGANSYTLVKKFFPEAVFKKLNSIYCELMS